ncbi:Membrane proteinase PrsW, cleaves anti-sigma factor RsiW, M82 family [Agrococcus baldri]|uniref:Membrane proteinase PrsW, cleaves anti-sigma factor RsiW, M82 family n=1 Tax=Agrococcus baldri TaxID=153730 RepID=A0AA94KYD9_9MICO|nr:PrsW family intramembrane metalloprotease [Agrococcus baldri]SFR97691.1 Membrane proteinase PrsW, cleaves anti-sigma factor RsiW, M82 family [Agrococcus baldri]
MSAPVPPSPFAPRSGPNVGFIAGVVGVVVLALASIAVIFILDGAIGDSALVAGSGLMALFPLGFVVWAVLAIDRWEPEPRIAMWFAALWGGIAAVLLTLWLNEAVLQPLVAPWLSSQEQFEFYATVIQAPITEELWKAIPVVIMFLFFRKAFDGPVDGIVFAALSAAGFAFTENILYFGTSISESGDGSFIFFMRGIMSPLTHAIFTSVGIGLALGFAARLRSRWWILLAFPAGHLVSALLHALWNSASWWVPGDTLGFFVYYLVVQVPLCLLAAGVVWLLLRQEKKITRVRLHDYGRAGWFSYDEVELLSSGDGRSLLMDWSRQRGLRKQMQQYIQTSTRLANHRQHALVGRDRARHVADEAGLLAKLMHLRRAMATVAIGQPVPMQQGMPVAAHAGARVQRFGDLEPGWTQRR